MLQKKKFTVILRIMIAAGAVLALGEALKFYLIREDYHKSEKLYETLAGEYVSERSVPSGGEDVNEETDSTIYETESLWYEMADVDMEGLTLTNPDIVGWLYFEDGEISYPILYSGDDAAYLHKAADGSYAVAGSIFLEGENTPDFTDCHSILYGHNMKNLSMFGKLKYYKNDDSYYGEHMYFQIITADTAYRYQIFAYEDVEAGSAVYRIPQAGSSAFIEMISLIRAMSLRDTDVSVADSDRIMTLSTCSAAGRNIRFVVHAVLVDTHVNQ